MRETHLVNRLNQSTNHSTRSPKAQNLQKTIPTQRLNNDKLQDIKDSPPVKEMRATQYSIRKDTQRRRGKNHTACSSNASHKTKVLQVNGPFSLVGLMNLSSILSQLSNTVEVMAWYTIMNAQFAWVNFKMTRISGFFPNAHMLFICPALICGSVPIQTALSAVPIS